MNGPCINWALPAKVAAATAAGCNGAMTPAETADRAVKGHVVVDAVGNIGALPTAVEPTAPEGRTITVDSHRQMCA